METQNFKLESFLDSGVIDLTDRGRRAPTREIVVRAHDDAGTALPTAEFVWKGASVDKRKARAALFRFAAIVEELTSAARTRWYVTPPSAVQSRGVDSFVGRVSIELHEEGDSAEARTALFVLNEAVTEFCKRR